MSMNQLDEAFPALRQAPARPSAVLQRRGVARVNAILQAAEELMAEEGYEAATLKAISQRTGIPAASVYHYFADRYQVDAAVMSRHIDALSKVLGDVDGVRTVAELVEAILDPQVAYFRQHPACAQLWLHGRNEAVAALADDFDAAATEAVWQIAVTAGIVPEDTPLLVAHIAYAAGAALFDTAFKLDPRGDEAVLQETKRLVSAYLSSYATGPQPAASARSRRGSAGSSKSPQPTRRRASSA